MPRALGLVALLAVAAGWAVLRPLGVGFVSDDLELLQRAREVLPGAPGSRGVLTDWMWAALAAGGLGPAGAHAVAGAVHLGNTLLVFHGARWLGAPRAAARAAAAWFLALAAGREALCWTAAHPYVPVATAVLVAVLAVLWAVGAVPPHVVGAGHARGRGDVVVPVPPPAPRSVVRVGLLLAACLLLASGFWDTGMLVAGHAWIAGVAVLAAPSRIRLVAGPLLLPVTLAAVAVSWQRAASGSVFGYGLGLDGVRTAYFLASAPVRALWPGFDVSFYRSAAGLALAAGVWATLLLSGRRDPVQRALVACFLLDQLPYALGSAPQSRYFVVATALLALWAARAARTRPRAGAGALAALAAASFVHAEVRTGAWERASAEVAAVHRALDRELASLAGTHPRIVVVDLPDRSMFAGPGTHWAPWMWRNGLPAVAAAHGVEVVRVETPGVAWRVPGSPIPVHRAGDLPALYPGVPVYRVRSGGRLELEPGPGREPRAGRGRSR